MASTKSKNKKRSVSKSSHRTTKVELKIPDAWINELETLQVNDPSWTCLVALFVEQCSNMTVYIEHFNDAAINGDRLAVKAISTLDVAKTVIKNRLDGSSERQVTPLALLCSEIYKLVGPDFEENIPKELLAPLVKYIILEYKEWNKKVREGIKRVENELDDYQQGLWNLSNSPGKKSKSEEKSLKIDKTLKSNIKKFTKLRRRGEEWKDKQWIDDSPLDGPNLYIVLSTFYDADLVLELLKFDIPLQVVVKIDLVKTLMNKTSLRDSYQQDMLQFLADFRRRSLPFLRTSIKSKKLSSGQLNKIISHFWNRLEYLKTSIVYALLYKDLMFLTYDPQNNGIRFQIEEFQEDMYREITHFLYDAFETTRHHKNYLREMKVMDLSDSNVCLLSEMEIYNSILDNIPHEVLTIPLILEALLSQICNSDRSVVNELNEEENNTMNTDSKSVVVNDNLQNLLDSLNLKYDLPRDYGVKDQPRFSSTPPNEKIRAFKTILQYSDDIKLKTFHLDAELADFIVSRSNCILKTAWKGLLDMDCASYIINSRFNELCNEIIQFYQETDHDSLYYYLHLLIINNVFDSLLLLNTRREPNQASFRQINCTDLCEECLRDCCVDEQFRYSSLSNNITSTGDGMDEDIIASNMFFVEDMNTDILFQNIQSSRHNYNWLVKKYCPYTDQLVLIFHNLPYYFEEQWVGKLNTPVPLRDFVDYILNEEEFWLNETILQKHYGLTSETANSYCNFQQESQLLRKIQDISDLDMEFISHRSIKYEAMMKQKKNLITSKKSSLTGRSTLPISKTKSTSLKNTASSDVKRKETKFINTVIPESFFEDVENQDFKYFGYDQGEPMRFQFNGSKKSNALGRNCKVTLDTFKKLYGKEYNRLNITICGHNLFYTLDPKSNSITPFHLILSSGIVLYFGAPGSEISETSFQEAQLSEIKQSQELPIPDTKATLEQDVSKLHAFSVKDLQSKFCTSNNFVYQVKECKYYDIPFLYKLKMSTPSGLYVELEEVNNLLYVRQTQLSTQFLCINHGQEKFRCCLSTGFILKFFDNGKVVALGPNGEIYTIYLDSTSAGSSHEDIVKELFSEGTNNVLHTGRDAKNDIHSKSGKNKLNRKSKKHSSESYKENIDAINHRASEHPKPSFTHSQSTNLLVNTYKYKFTTSDGKQYEIQGPNCKPLEDLLLTSNIDIPNNCISSERSDQVTTKHMIDGSLVVKYSDGSQVTSIPTQSEDIFCEWSTEELVRWFIPSEHSFSKDDVESNENSNERKSYRSSNKELNSTLTDSLKEKNERHDESSLMKNKYSLVSKKSSGIHNKPNYSQDGFVVYNISYILEHANYGLVYFDSNNCQIDFDLPESTRVSLQKYGSYHANFDRASLTVDGTKIHFNEHNEAGGIERTNVIYKSDFKINSNDVIDQENISQQSLTDTIEEVRLKSLTVKGAAVESITRKSYLTTIFDSVDSYGNKMYIDYNLHFHNTSENTEYNKINNNDFACFVVDKDFKGFRILSQNEVNEYIHFVMKKRGLVKENEGSWKSTFTSIAINTNEFEKWLVMNKKDGNRARSISTYSRRESWCQPFKEKPDVNTEECQVSDVVVVRLLRKIETDHVMLNYLHEAIKAFKKRVPSMQPLRKTMKKPKVYLNIDDIVVDPDILEHIYKEEAIKKTREDDKVRKQMKNIFTNSLVRQACIRSRNTRIKMKVKEMQTKFRTKSIPPYYWSCFGAVRNILNEVIERVYAENTYDKINSIVDSILNFISNEKEKSGEPDSEIRKKESIGMSHLVTEILENLYRSIGERNLENIVNTILEKPLSLLTLEEVEFLCKIFQSQTGKCPILISEEIVLQDVLEARHQLSHYFSNLKDMLECYRVHIKDISICE